MNIKATNLSIKMDSNIKQHIVGIPDSKSKSRSHKKNDLPIMDVEKSATVDFSKDGRELAKKLREDKRKETKINIEETWKQIGEADRLSNKIESGEELTDVDKEFINDNLQKITSERYVYNKTHIITKDEYEAVLKTLKENFEARLNMYADMQKKLDAQGLEDEHNKNAQFIAKAKQDENEKQRIIDILKETLDVDDEDEEEENKKTESDENKDDSALEFDETGKTADEQLIDRAFDLIDKNKEAVDEMSSRYVAAAESKNEYDKLMDEEFLRISDLLANDELSEEEKLKEFKTSNDYMTELNANKIRQEVINRFDFSSWLIGKIEFNNHNKLKDVLNLDGVDSGMGGIDMVRDFLINDNSSLRK